MDETGKECEFFSIQNTETYTKLDTSKRNKMPYDVLQKNNNHTFEDENDMNKVMGGKTSVDENDSSENDCPSMEEDKAGYLKASTIEIALKCEQCSNEYYVLEKLKCTGENSAAVGYRQFGDCKTKNTYTRDQEENIKPNKKFGGLEAQNVGNDDPTYVEIPFRKQSKVEKIQQEHSANGFKCLLDWAKNNKIISIVGIVMTVIILVLLIIIIVLASNKGTNADGTSRNCGSVENNGVYEESCRRHPQGPPLPTRRSNGIRSNDSIVRAFDIQNTDMSMQGRNSGCFDRKSLIIVTVLSVLLITTILGLAISLGQCKSQTDSNNGGAQCSWSVWSSWTECPLLPIYGTQYRVSVYRGPAQECKHNESIQSRKCEDPRFNFDLKFDARTNHPGTFVTTNKKILSNYYIDNHFTDNGGHFANYSGAIADTCIKGNSKIYFVMAYNFTITKSLDAGAVVLEVAVSERDQVDDFPFVGENPKGWSFNVFRYENSYKLNLAAQRGATEKIINDVGHYGVGNVASGELAILIDRERDELSLLDGTRVRFKFTDFRSDKLLCPVFGIFGDGNADVVLQIKSAKNLTNLFQYFWT